MGTGSQEGNQAANCSQSLASAGLPLGWVLQAANGVMVNRDASWGALLASTQPG